MSVCLFHWLQQEGQLCKQHQGWNQGQHEGHHGRYQKLNYTWITMWSRGFHNGEGKQWYQG